ncbi:MAG: N-formylglutamate amidohydrolase [Deltaproteobacteria bacterium]|nr:N-formylglutamate amidohydrolase [Deltaproteobacteria bacterium]
MTTSSKSLLVFAGSPEVAASPVVLSVPHAGILVPAQDAPLLAVSGKGLLKDADLHVDRLVQRVPALGVPVVVAQISRYVLDVNRAPDDVDREVCPEIERPARPSARGLCWRTTTDGAAVLVRPLTLAELRSRLQRIHEPYHETLAELLQQRRQRFGYAVLLDVHSMPSLGRPGHTDPGARRADIVPGDLRGTSCSPLLSKLVADHFAGAGLSVRANDPYMGGYVTKQHGRPARGVHAIQVELNRDLYMDEASFALVDDKAAVVTGLLLGLVEKVKALQLPS